MGNWGYNLTYRGYNSFFLTSRGPPCMTYMNILSSWFIFMYTCCSYPIASNRFAEAHTGIIWYPIWYKLDDNNKVVFPNTFHVWYIYIATFTVVVFMVNVEKYTSPIDAMGSRNTCQKNWLTCCCQHANKQDVKVVALGFLPNSWVMWQSCGWWEWTYLKVIYILHDVTWSRSLARRANHSG